MQELLEQLEAHIKSRYEIEDDDDDFSVDVHLFDYGYIDSIGATALIAHIEKTYGIQVTNQDLMLYPLNTVREIATFIHNKKER
ncbi:MULTISPECIES: acyl carrier protein [Paenibacillus]|uniref:Acyl carrier protein n=2 Tax=Paenibacillus TaxID=44249 RepID=A0A161S0Z0_9BACL|nr:MULTISPECIES: acyl carrier protein [Paenibacillus]KZE77844.1 phosphopantetheine attachment protein [Paenibacillus elgii]MCP1310411.1 acyl carrier protein [Paenibacillus tyrfis]MCP3775003.1 acyl carrier protein [Paenibacillus sp. MZ04-78.2]MDO3678771.1 acyl carrier protein [Paenibacillus ehimensis]MEC0209482.1 acyl carrier protein [Paenibacillus ehimensis]